MSDIVLSTEDIWCPYAYEITEVIDFRMLEGIIVRNDLAQYPPFKDGR